jgi:hypothetical protein
LYSGRRLKVVHNNEEQSYQQQVSRHQHKSRRNLLPPILPLNFRHGNAIYWRDGAIGLYQKKLHQIIFPTKKSHIISSSGFKVIAIFVEGVQAVKVREFPRSLAITPQVDYPFMTFFTLKLVIYLTSFHT